MTGLDLQVVVDTEATAKALLARGRLRARVTIIPLNKARSSINVRPCLGHQSRVVLCGSGMHQCTAECWLESAPWLATLSLQLRCPVRVSLWR